MSLLEISKLIEPIAEPLNQVEQMLAEEASASEFPFINRASQHITLDHGKRLRPILVLSAAKAFGKVTIEHIKLSVIIELIHTATLLHDDVLDEAQTRRHRTSINSVWGNTTSVLLGDYLFARALMLLSSLGSKDLFFLVSEATKDVCEGEILQIQNARKIDLDEANYFEIVRKKTASLFTACCKGSAIISGLDTSLVNAMAKYGELLGNAFQIGDDILDIMGSSSEEGKTLGTDLEKGKMTLPLIHLLKHLSSEEKKLLEDIIVQSNHDVPESKIQLLLAKGRGLPETFEVVSNLCKNASLELGRFPSNFELTLFKVIPQYVLSQAQQHLSETNSLLKVS